MAEYATSIENARNLSLKAALRRDAGEMFPEPEAATTRQRFLASSADAWLSPTSIMTRGSSCSKGVTVWSGSEVGVFQPLAQRKVSGIDAFI